MKKILILAAMLLLASACHAATAEVNDINTLVQGSNISLVLKNAPITSVLSTLGNETGFNIVAGTGVKGNVTISLKDVAPVDALNSVLRSSGYIYKIDGNIIRVMPSSYAKSGGDEIANERGVITKAFAVSNITADDAKEMVSGFAYPATKVLSAKGSNVFVVEAPIATMIKIERIIGRIDGIPNQVLVESRIMEVTAGNSATPSTMGLKAKYTGSTYTAQTEGLADPATVGAPGFYAHVVKGGVDAYLETLEHKEGFNLLANPKVVAVSGKPASIISGSKLGYKTTLTTTTGTVQNIDFLEVGTKLSFTAFISNDGTIKMEIHPEVSEGTVTADGLPQKQTTEATTTVVVRDGETIIIGGLIKNKSNEGYTGVPVIMNIPVIGNFFKKKEILWEKKEIIAMLTPHIVTPQKLKQMANEIKNLEDRQKDNATGEEPGLMWWVK